LRADERTKTEVEDLQSLVMDKAIEKHDDEQWDAEHKVEWMEPRVP
jgi:hypothetical protein